MNFCMYCMEPLEAGAAFCPKCGKAQSDDCPPHHLQPGTLLSGRYLLGTALGSGGFGITYIAHDTRLEMTVAVKEFYPVGYVTRNGVTSVGITATTQGSDFFERGRAKFLAEAKILASLHDEPGIVDVRDFFEENNTTYIVMEYLRGETLKAYLNRTGALPLRQAYTLLRPVLDSLSAAHAKNVVHRDIAPDNIMLTRRGAKLLDFGSAREVFSEDERSLSILVKRGYSPYEQYTKKNQGPWTDVYSMCAVFYRVVTGHPPEDALERMRAPDAPLNFDGAALRPQMQAVLTRGLAVFPEQRYRSIGELLRALDDAAAVPDRPPVMPKDEHTLPAVEPTRMGVVPAPIPQPQPVVKPQQIDHTRATEAVWRGSPASQTDATVKAPARRPVQRLANAAVGQTVFFGSYPQESGQAHEKSPIEWLVLAREENRALLISKYALDCKPYNKKWKKVTWETCSLREWLNGEFLNAAFTPMEQSRIQFTDTVMGDDPFYRDAYIDNTPDRVFFLNADEAAMYFKSNPARVCLPTKFALAQRVWVSDEGEDAGTGACWWWLRLSQKVSHYAPYVDDDGRINVEGDFANYEGNAVRPAMWVTLDG
ncbi:MAG: protein kinase [Clostridia bacterium]|nr:protein kinase [Clostridia bacterium]